MATKKKAVAKKKAIKAVKAKKAAETGESLYKESEQRAVELLISCIRKKQKGGGLPAVASMVEQLLRGYKKNTKELAAMAANSTYENEKVLGRTRAKAAYFFEMNVKAVDRSFG